MAKKRRTGKAAKKQAKPQRCMWYELPLELRYKIYEEACFQDSHVTVDSLASRQWEAPFMFSEPLAARAFACLLATCKSIYFDLQGYPLLWKNRYFEFDEPQVLHSFVRSTPQWARHFITHVDLEPRRVMVHCQGRSYSTNSPFQVLVGANDVPATAPDPGAIVAALTEVLPRLKRLRIIFSWHTAPSLGAVPVVKHVIRELIRIPDLRARVPGNANRREGFSFGFVVAVKFDSWNEKARKGEGYHKWCIHCFINEFRSKDGPIKKYGGKLRNMLRGIDWCVDTDEHRPFRRENVRGDDTDPEDSGSTKSDWTPG